MNTDLTTKALSQQGNVRFLDPKDFVRSFSERDPAGYHHGIVVNLDGEEVIYSNRTMARDAILSDDNYFLMMNRDGTPLLAIPSDMIEGSEIHGWCLGTHGGMSGACNDCRWNTEEAPENHVWLSTTPCRLSEHYFQKPYWFQQRLIDSITIN